MSDPKSRLSTRVEVFTAPKFHQRYSLHREQVQGVLRAAVAAHGFGLHTLMVAEWDGASSLKVLAVQGRTLQLPLQPGADTLVGVAMAKVMGHVALGLCESERPAALTIDEAQLPPGSTLMVCPIVCAVSSAGQGVLVAIHAPAGQTPPPARGSSAAKAEGPAPSEAAIPPAEVGQEEQRLRGKGNSSWCWPGGWRGCCSELPTCRQRRRLGQCLPESSSSVQRLPVSSGSGLPLPHRPPLRPTGPIARPLTGLSPLGGGGWRLGSIK